MGTDPIFFRYRIVLMKPQLLSQDGRKSVVDQKLHFAVNGKPRSRTASVAQRESASLECKGRRPSDVRRL